MLDKTTTPPEPQKSQTVLPFMPRAPAQAPPDHLAESSDDFDWSARNPEIAIIAQPATAVYVNTWGGIVIRQENPEGADEDPFVIVAPQNLRALIIRLEKFATGALV